MNELPPQLRLLRDFYYKTALKLPTSFRMAHAPGLIEDPAFFTLAQLQGHLNNPLLTPEWFSLIWEGKPVDCTPAVGRKSIQASELSYLDEGIIDDYVSRGASLVLRGVEFFEPVINAMCAAIDTPHKYVMSSAIAFFSQSGSALVGVEANDMLIIHLAGQSRWRIYERLPTGLPIPDDLTALALAQPQDEIVMKPGDALYLRNGTPHSIETMGPYDLHMCFDICDQNITAATALSFLAQEFNLDATPCYTPPRDMMKKILRHATSASYLKRLRDLQAAQAESCKLGRAIIGNNRITHLAALMAGEDKISA